MPNLEVIQSEIIADIKPIWDCSNIKEVVSQFLKILEADPINEPFVRGLEDRYAKANFNKFPLALKDIAVGAESFLKTLYSIITPANVPSGAFASCLKRFFREKIPTLFANEPKDKFFGWVSPSNPNPNTEPAYFNEFHSQGSKIKTLYDIRNALTHGKKRIPYPSYDKPLDDLHGTSLDIRDCLVVCLLMAQAYQTELENVASQEHYENLQPYFESVRAKFEDWQDIFVDIVGTEQSRHQNYLFSHAREELIGQGNAEAISRENTIDYLRKYEVPEKRMVVLGEAGMGKTSTLQFLTLSDASSQENVPIYVAFRDLLDSSTPLKEYIHQEITNICQVNVEEVRKMLRLGEVTLFLDGLNEVLVDQKRQRHRELKKLLQEYPDTFIIITSRKQDYDYSLKTPTFSLVEMGADQIQEFLEKHAAGQQEVIAAINEKINSDVGHNWLKMLAVPLMLKILINMTFLKLKAKADGGLDPNTPLIPNQTTLIIREFIEGLYQWEKENDVAFTKDSLHRLLIGLATRSFRKGQNATLDFKEVRVLPEMRVCWKEWIIYSRNHWNSKY